MSDDLFLSASELSALVGYIGEFVGFGVALGAIFWVLGYVMWWVIDSMRGGF